MDKNTPPSKDDSIPWTVILTILTLTFVSAWLVFIQGWSLGKAIAIVAIVAQGIIGLLFGILWLVSDREGRDDIRRSFKHTLYDDLDRILKYFRITGRK